MFRFGRRGELLFILISSPVTRHFFHALGVTAFARPAFISAFQISAFDSIMIAVSAGTFECVLAHSLHGAHQTDALESGT
jgi:hypothetical protein